MKFKVRKTSVWNDDIQPCEEAKKEKYTYIEIRTLSSFEEFDKKFGKREGTWLSKGIKHCINKQNYIQRELPNNSEGWFIEINSLKELLRFQEKYGDLVLGVSWDNENILEIEIYDGYRE